MFVFFLSLNFSVSEEFFSSFGELLCKTAVTSFTCNEFSVVACGLLAVNCQRILSFSLESRIVTIPETEAVASLGSVVAAAEQILLDMPLPKLVKARVKPKRKLRAWEIVLIAVGSPVWFPILLALAAVVLAVYIVLWAVAVSLYAADIGVGAGSVAGVAGAALMFVMGHPASALALLSAGFVCGGLTIFGFFGCNAAAKGIWRLGKLMWRGIKSCFIRKEEA